MDENEFIELIDKTKKIREKGIEVTTLWQDKLVSQMVRVADLETERIEHHLLEMPLSVIIYQWIIIRLKTRPWRLLIPASVALTLILQGFLSKFNLLQIMVH